MNGLMRLFCRFCLVAALFAKVATAQADVMYQCIDEQGHKTFSNVRLTDKGVKCTAMDLGPAAAFSIIYFLIVLLFCWLFYQALQAVGTGDKS